ARSPTGPEAPVDGLLTPARGSGMTSPRLELRAHRTADLGVLCGALAVLLIFIFAPSAQAAFGPLPGAEGFSVATTNADESPTTQAGGHPFSLSVHLRSLS